MSQQLTAEMVAALAAKASPGPWRWHGDDNLVCEVFTEILSAGDDGREYGFHSGLIEHHFDPATKEANAALIAAAPAMAHLIETQAVELAAKDARIAELEKNDARYRYIRERICLTCVTAEPDPQDLADEYPEQVDEFIDAALAPSRAALMEKGDA